MRYLTSHLLPEADRQRCHFYNTFFFEKLHANSPLKDLIRWTRSVRSLFQKDFLFIPVHCGHHWSFLVVCLCGAGGYFREAPCVLHLDSFGGTFGAVTAARLRAYLDAEREARGERSGGDRFNEGNLPLYDVRVPQQRNSFDCGVFMLCFLRLFVVLWPRAIADFAMWEQYMGAGDLLNARFDIQRLILTLSVEQHV
eukprot:TRINITY_DN1705_c0_g1_i15.p1 TRINITY_DN1705_c0_g1~~TRINITY_DN1705_c0_g1_i15.p1  ORF type:complete len:197 (-),score=60.59 TRINITY_DN1705_c0_g1_i15:43-633(-)